MTAPWIARMSAGSASAGAADLAPEALAAERPEEEPPAPGVQHGIARLLRSLVLPVLAVFTALVLGAVVVALSDQQIWPLWLSSPGEAISRSWTSVIEAYGALFTGALGNPGTYVSAFASGDSAQIVKAFNPISETLLASTPLIFTGLAVALGFRVGLFNIGAEGQLYMGAMLGTFVGFSAPELPMVIHLPLAIAAGFLGGAIWGFIPGFLKARTGAHEVIVTIMLNYVAYRSVDFILTQSFYQRPGRIDPISRIVAPGAVLPPLVDGLRVHWGLFLALGAAAAVSWLLFRSTWGFEFRAVGLNPSAARAAGMSISRALIVTMALSGGLAGLGGASEILGANKSLTAGFSPGYGFDALALALLGGSRPGGVVAAALLVGALRAGATPMQAATGIPIDLVVVIQALVIMFVAAPALIRNIYRIRAERITGTEVLARGWR